MHVVSANKTNDVGIVTDPDNIRHIGTFSPALLKEWWKMVANIYGEEQEVHLFIRKSDSLDAWVIFASSNGENPFVAVCGKYPADGKTWEDKDAQ